MANPKYERWLTDEGLILIEGWARDGLTDEQIAHNMGISARTLYEWKDKFPQISQTLKKGKEVVDFIVENALFKNAIGYDVEEYEEKIDNKGRVVPTKKIRHIPGNVTAQIYWLKNRRPDKWRDKPVAEIADSADAHNALIDAIKGLTDDED